MKASAVFAVFMLWLTAFAQAAVLYPDQAIYKGQSLPSDDGRYQLIMQYDGNLVYYRTSDWAVRWATYTNNRGGHVAIMQRDGNFVVYDPNWNAVWDASTNGRPGAYIAAQTDGNLVIHQDGRALWNIGADNSIEDPKYPADVIGRNMENNMPYAPLGHVGMYDGRGGIYEVLNDGKPNAVAYNTLDNFKGRAYNGYWGGASPNIPHFYGIGYFNDFCGSNSYQVVDAKWGMVMRAFQILYIGAEYTYFASSTRTAYARTSTSPAQPGRYRCDTFLIDIYKALYLNPTNATGQSLNVLAPENSAIERWFNFTAGYLQLTITPRTVFDKLKNYAG